MTLSRFRGDFYDRLNGRGDGQFDLADALLCPGRPYSLVAAALETGPHLLDRGAGCDPPPARTG
ncbi:hypothetical protein SAZ11_59390 [Streptomyces sp. FXJ1.4098]|nr:hypothetical protein [Streptomyces sp. FXJ1.4098]